MEYSEEFLKVLETEYSEQFDRLQDEILPEIFSDGKAEQFIDVRKKAMVMGHYKYGPIKANREQKATDMIQSIYMRIDKYERTGNTEFLADIANFAMIEFMYPAIKYYYEQVPNTFSFEGSSQSDVMRYRMKKYEETGNTGWLVKVAALCAHEFKEPRHPNTYFRYTDSDQSPGLHGFSVNEMKRFKEDCNE